MRIPEPLRNNPFRFRKKRSLHSKLYSENPSDPIRPIDSISYNHGTHGQVRLKDYMSGLPEEYAPHPGFMQIPQGTYEPYDEFQDITVSNFGGVTDTLRFAAMGSSGNNRTFDKEVKYEDGLMTEELLQEQISGFHGFSLWTLIPSKKAI